MENNEKDYIRVYIAGRLRGNWIQKRINIWRAKRIAKWLWKRGIAVFCPHANSGYIDSKKTDEFVIRANIDFMLSCDVILVFDKKWYNSKGTMKEITKAYSDQINLYFYKEDLLNDKLRGGIYIDCI